MAAANSFQELQKWTRAGLVYAITQHEVSIDLTSKVNTQIILAQSCGQCLAQAHLLVTGH